jgi:hypothetical protein
MAQLFSFPFSSLPVATVGFGRRRPGEEPNHHEPGPPTMAAMSVSSQLNLPDLLLS